MSADRTKETRPERTSATAPRRRLAPPSRIVDTDEERARATEALLGPLSERLGFRTGDIRVCVDDEAASRTRARGARGLLSGSTIWLDPARYDPARADGRAVLAHEAAHAAQRAEARLRPDRRRPSLAESEREAAAVAEAVREGRAPLRPVATLPPGVEAGDDGAAAVVTAEPTPVREPVDALEVYRTWQRVLDSLGDLVGRVYPRQLRDMRSNLDGWWVSDGDVDRVMAILDPLPVEDAAALVRALGSRLRVRLVDNVSDSHRHNFRRSVLASYAGVTSSELKYFDQSLFDDLSLVLLSPKERFLAIVTLLNVRIDVRRRLLAGDRSTEFRALMQGRAPDPAERLAELRARAGALLRRREAAQRIENDPRTATLIATLERLLRDPGEADARAALQQLAPLVPAAAPQPTPVAAGDGRPPGTTDSAEPAPAAETQEPEELGVILERLELSGAVNRLVRHLSDRDRYTPGPLRDTFIAVLRARPVDANVRLAVSLLDTGIFSDWWITDAEARLAYDVVQALPLDARDSFFRRDDGRWLTKLEENLPEDVLGRPDFADFSIRDENGRLVDVGARRAETLRGRQGSRVLAEVLRLVEREQGGTGARRILAELAAIQPPDVRDAVIGRLDTLGKLDGVINRLADDVLYSEVWRVDLGIVLAARDPRHLERHIRSLLSTGFLRLDWAVNSHEAFLAFQMLRALSPADRERFGQLSFIVGEMSASMRASAGLHMLDGRSAAAQRDAVRVRLRDERLWTAEHAAELRSLVGILVALGDRSWVFDRSREQRAWTVEALRPMVLRYRLYDERTGRTRYVPEQVQEARFWDDYGVFSIMKILGKVLCIVARDGFWGRFYANPVAEELGYTGFKLSQVQDMLGGDVGGVRLRDRDAGSDDDERAAASAGRGGGEQDVSTNEVSMRWNQRVGMLWMSLPALELDTIGMVGNAWSFHTGRVSARGINVWAEFQTDDFSHPRQAEIRVSDIELDDVLVGSERDVKSVARVHLGSLGIRGDMGEEPPPPSNSTLLPIPVFGPLIEWIRLLVEAKRMASGAAGQLSEGAAELRGVTVEVGTIELEGLSLGADQQIASLTIAGLRLAWGGTRTQYLRALIAALDRRIAAASEGAELDRMRIQRDEAGHELAELVPNERRLLELLRRSQSDPDSITAADNAEILRLQQTGRGGVVVDAGTITVRGLGGAVSAREITVDRLRGQGTSEALTAAVLTDPVLLQRFAREGPPLEETLPATDRSAVELEAGTITATDVAVEAEIPATAVLEQQRAQLMTDRVRLEQAHDQALLGRVDSRIDFLLGLIRLRGELDELEALGTRATGEQMQRRRELHTLLARYFGITVGRAELRGVTLSGDLERGTLGARAAELEVTDVVSDAFGVQRVTGTDVSGELPFAAGLAGLQGLPETIGAGGATAGVGTLHLEGVRADALGSTVGAVDLAGFSASAQRVPGGWKIPDLRIASLAVDGIDYGTADRRLRSSRPLTLSGLEASLTITTAGEGDAAQTTYAIERVDIAELAVAGPSPGTGTPARGDPALSYEDLVTGMRVNLFGGALRGIWAAGLTIRQSDAGTTFERPIDTPVAGVRQFDALRFSTAFAASFRLGGVLSSPQGQAQDAFGVQLAADGSAVLDLLNLALSDATMTTPNGSIRIERLPASGRVRYRSAGDISDIGLEGFRIPQLVLGEIDWRMDDGARVTAEGRTVLTGIAATLGMRMDAEGLARASVTRLRIDRISSDDLWYRKPPAEIHLYDAVAAPPLDVRDVLVEGLRWDRTHGITSGNVDVGSAAVGVDAFTIDMGVKGTLRAQQISLRFEPRKLTARAQQVDANLEVGMGGVSAALAISGLDTGGIEVTPNQIRIGAGADPHLSLGTTGRITIGTLHFEDRTKTVKFDVGASGSGGIELRELDSAMTIDLNPAGTEPRIRRVTIDSLTLDRVTVTELTIDDEVNGRLHISGPASRATLVDARVSKLALEPSPDGGWGIAGYERMYLDMLALDEVEVGVEIGDILRRRADAARAAATPGGPKPAPFDPRTLAPYRPLFDNLDGHVNVDVVLAGVYTVTARVAITRGQVDVKKIEHAALGSLADELFDFELDSGQLILEFDPRRAGAALAGLAGLGLGAYARTTIMRWNLTTGEVQTYPTISLYSLTQFERPAKSGSSTDDDDARLDLIELENIDAVLSLVNESSTELTLPGGLGRVVLAPFALRDLTIKGELLQPGTSAPLELQVSLGTLRVEGLDLNLGGFGRFESSTLLLDGLTTGTLEFFGLDPQHFSGHVHSLIWRELTLTGTPAGDLSPIVPTPAGMTP